jgi:hypothetical protein
MPRTVRAARYVVPFREGSSVPALVEGDDCGMYVVKLRGAAQGAKALVAEWVAGELARAAGLLVPEIVLVELDAALADSEPDPEISDPLEASAGLNLGLDYLPGSITFDPVAGPAADALVASRIVLFDAVVLNVDRTPRNPNLLAWHGRLWLIDHGASLWFHHGWRASNPLEGAADPFPQIRDHVLLPSAAALAEAASHLASAASADAIDRIVAEIPAAWLADDDGFADPVAHRAAYGAWLRARIARLPAIAQEVAHARTLLV